MYLKKLGEERYKARASRKSVVKKFSALELRTSIEEEEEMIIGEIAVNEKYNFLNFGVTTVLFSLGQKWIIQLTLLTHALPRFFFRLKDWRIWKRSLLQGCTNQWATVFRQLFLKFKRNTCWPAKLETESKKEKQKQKRGGNSHGTPRSCSQIFLKVTYLMCQDSCPVRRTCPRNK